MTEAGRDLFFTNLYDEASGDEDMLGCLALLNGKPTLSMGSSGGDVKSLQKDLAKLGYYAASPSGKFDEATKDGVELLQWKAGLPMTGVMDSASWAALSDLTGGSSAKVAQTAADIGAIFTGLATGFGGSAEPAPAPVDAPEEETPWLLYGAIGLGGLILVGGVAFVLSR